MVSACEPWSFVGVQVGGWVDTRPCMSGDRSGERSKGELAQRASLGSVEVIQPQIPLRLPCYDLSPLAKPRFDSWNEPHPDLTRVL